MIAAAAHPPRALAVAAMALLLAYGAVSLIAAAAMWSGAAHYETAAAVQFLFFIATGVTVLGWTYRAGQHVRQAGAQHLSATPAMAIIWYFIPVANLFMPYTALRDIWKASIDPKDWEAIATPTLLSFWWGSWLLSNIIGLAVWRLGEFGIASVSLAGFSAASDLLGTLCAILLAAIIWQVGSFQKPS